MHSDDIMLNKVKPSAGSTAKHSASYQLTVINLSWLHDIVLTGLTVKPQSAPRALSSDAGLQV